MKNSTLRSAALCKKSMQGGQLIPCSFVRLLVLGFMLAAPEEALTLPSKLFEQGSVHPPLIQHESPTGLRAAEGVESSAFLAPAADAQSVHLLPHARRPLGFAAQGALALISALMVVFVLFCFAHRFSSEKTLVEAHARRLAAWDGGPPPPQCNSLEEVEEAEAHSTENPFDESPGTSPDDEEDDDDDDEYRHRDWVFFHPDVLRDAWENDAFWRYPPWSFPSQFETRDSEDDEFVASRLWGRPWGRGDEHDTDEESYDPNKSDGESSSGGDSSLFTANGESNSGDEASTEDEGQEEGSPSHTRFRKSRHRDAKDIFPPGFHPFYKAVWLQGTEPPAGEAKSAFPSEVNGSRFSSEIDGDDGSDEPSEGEYVTASEDSPPSSDTEESQGSK
ncbi:hypothetical protein ACSSS7_001335 [Eimeria intestinalis]